MWFGTYDGLNRYDGYDFKIYRNRPGDSRSIIHNYVNTIDEDDKTSPLDWHTAGNQYIGSCFSTIYPGIDA